MNNIIYIGRMKHCELQEIEIGGSFRFGGVYFRVDEIADFDKSLIVCQIAAKPGVCDSVEVDGGKTLVGRDFEDAFVYIAGCTTVEVE